MKRFILRGGVAMVLTLALLAGADEPATPTAPPPIDPKADQVLKSMGQALAAAKQISFDAHAISDELTPDGQKLQHAKNQKVVLKRPDKLAADVTGDLEDLVFRYDGKRVTLYNPRTQSWGSAEAPASIDEALDLLAGKYGMALPLADLVFADPYKCLTENVRSGEYVGVGYVFDARCHHLAFRQAAVDWQIWIEEKGSKAGQAGLPRKVVITFKEAPGHPQYTAFLSNWNLAADAPDAAFTFTPPAGAKQVEFAAPPTSAKTGEESK